MAGVNKVVLLGYIGSEIETRYSEGGKAVSNFSLATSENWKDKDGNRQEKTEWHKIVFFGRTAEICQEYLSKGKQIYLEGKIQTRQWEDKEGNKRYTTEVVGQTMQMLGKQSEPEFKPEPSQEQAHPDISDIPF